MQKKMKALVYPFDKEFCPILRNKNILDDYDILAVISPNGWGYNGEDAGTLDGGLPVGVFVENDFWKYLEICDAVIFASSQNKLDFESNIYPKILDAIEAGKNVLCTLELEEQLLKNIVQLCRSKDIEFKYYNAVADISDNKLLKGFFIDKINVPVIFVLGISEGTNKFEVQLALRNNLQQKGYKVSQVGTRSYCELLGFHSFPKFMMNSKIPEKEKIILFNNYIKNIELNESPDVIIIGIPGGIMRFSDEFIGDFGILAYEVAQAIKPDTAVFCSIYEDFLPVYFEEIYKTVKYRLGFEVDCFTISNNKIDWNISRTNKAIKLIKLDTCIVNKKISQLNTAFTKFFNVLNQDEGTLLTDYLINRMASDGYEAI